MGIFTGPGGPQVFSSASGGKMYGLNTLDVTAQVVVPANPSRQKVTFHNPGTVDFYVAPVVNYNGVPFTPAIGTLAGSFVVFGNGGTLEITGECQTAWQAFSASGSNNPITAMDSNIG